MSKSDIKLVELLEARWLSKKKRITDIDMSVLLELARKGAEADALRSEVERLRAALREWENAVHVGVTAEGPIYIGVSSTLGQKAWKLTRAALGDTHE